jgi:hypothetical protein
LKQPEDDKFIIRQASTATKGRKQERLGANKEEKSHDLYTSYMNSWYDYVNTCNSMYAEYLRNIMEMTKSWFNLFSKSWSVQYKDKVKAE